MNLIKFFCFYLMEACSIRIYIFFPHDLSKAAYTKIISLNEGPSSVSN